MAYGVRRSAVVSSEENSASQTWHRSRSVERLWVKGKSTSRQIRYAFSSFSAVCCAWKQAASRATGDWSMSSRVARSLSALRNHPRTRSRVSYIDDDALAEGCRGERVAHCTPILHFAWRVDQNVDVQRQVREGGVQRPVAFVAR